jgi:nucleoside-diphosphate-sugar epimerase
MRMLIIGGTGFIGPAVVTRLSALGHAVTLFHRGQTQAELSPGVQHLPGDRRQLAAFAGECRRLAPDVVLDMFPMSEDDARTVMETFQGITGRVVAISSQDVYRAYDRLRRLEPGPPDPMPLTEDAPLRQRLYPYRGDDTVSAKSDDYEKILVERAVMGEARLPGTVLRLPMVYGPRDDQHRLFPFLKRMDDGRPAILLEEGTAGWRWSRGYGENVAAAIALAVTDNRAAGRIYNVAEAEALPMAEWVRRIGRAAGWDGKVVALPRGHLPAHLRGEDHNWDQHLVADTTRLRAELGYAEPIPQDEALRATVAWERAHPPEQIDLAQFDYAAEDAALASCT